MIAACLAAGCASPPSASPAESPAPGTPGPASPPATDAAPDTTVTAEPTPADVNRAIGYALLHDLMSKQRNVDKILVMKRPSPATADLLRDIAKTTGAAAKELETIARRESSITLDEVGLPDIEVAKSRSLEKATQQALLFGDQFETRMLVSQADGLLSGQHLALALAKDEPNPSYAAWLRKLAEDLGTLRDRAITQLAS